MKTRVVVRRRRARQDIDEAAAHYFHEGGAGLEARFIDMLQAAIRHIAAHPASGSPRYADIAQISGLRSWPLKRFPYLIFYVEAGDRIDVWRILHAQRDLAAWLQEDLTPPANQRTAPGE